MSATAGHVVTTVVVGGIVAVAAVARVGLVDDALVPGFESAQASAYAAGPVLGPASGLEHVSGLESVSEDVAVAAAAVAAAVGAASAVVGAASAAASATVAAAGIEVWEPGEGAESVVVEVLAGPVVRLAALLPSGFRV